LPPGASAVAVLLRGCGDVRWLEFSSSLIGIRRLELRELGKIDEEVLEQELKRLGVS